MAAVMFGSSGVKSFFSGAGEQSSPLEESLARIAAAWRARDSAGAAKEFSHCCTKFPHVPGAVYGHLWSVMGSPTPSTRPDIAHNDYGRVAYHDLEGRSAPVDKKAEAIELLLSAERTKRIAEIEKSCKAPTTSFEIRILLGKVRELMKADKEGEALKFFNEITFPADIVGAIYGQIWKILSSPLPATHPAISHPEFGKVVFHNQHPQAGKLPGCVATASQKAAAIQSVLDDKLPLVAKASSATAAATASSASPSQATPFVVDKAKLSALASTGRIEFRDEADAATGYLSGFYLCPVTMYGIQFRCAAAAFQAAKFYPDKAKMGSFASLTGHEARAHALKLTPSLTKAQQEGWKNRSLQIMLLAYKTKFSQNPSLKDALFLTKNAFLVEHTPADNFWGDGGNGKGANHSGRLLVQARDELGRMSSTPAASFVASPSIDLAGLRKIAATGTVKFYDHTDPVTYFLGNFFPCAIEVDGIHYHCSEATFQADKAYPNFKQMSSFAGLTGDASFKQAKLIMANWSNADHALWRTRNDASMLKALRAKFFQHPFLAEALLATGKARLIEHTSRDAYWGDGGNGKGKNRLGEFLMLIREELGGTGVV